MANRFRFLASIFCVAVLTISCSELGGAGLLGDLIGNSSGSGSGLLGGGRLSTAGLRFTDNSGGGIPEGSESIITGVQFIAADASSPYGTLIFTSSKQLDELYLQVAGESGYYSKVLTSSDIANKAGGEYGYSVDLDFAQGLNADGQKIIVSGRSTQGAVSIAKESQNSLIEERSCGNQSISGNFAGFIGRFDMRASYGSFKFEYETYNVPDEITVYSDSKARGTPLFHYPSGGTRGWMEEIIYFDSPTITIKVVGSREGTAWRFKAHCP